MLCWVWRGREGGGWMGGKFLVIIQAYAYISNNMSLLIGLEPFKKFDVGDGQKAFYSFGPNLGG